MRVALTSLTLLAGAALVLVSYFVLAAPAIGGPPVKESFSNPQVPFAPLFFVIGVILVFVAPLVYELLPSRVDE